MIPPRGWTAPRTWVPALLALTLLLAGPASARLYLSTLLDSAAGATSNRFLTADAEASSYLHSSPSIEALWFSDQGGELGGQLGYRHLEFAESGFGRQREWRANLWLLRPLGAWNGSVDLGGGRFRDSQVAEDDATWVHLAGRLEGYPTRRASGALKVSLTNTRYHGRRDTAGDLRRDTYLELRPSGTWRFSASSSAWCSLPLQVLNSSDPSEEFHGVGLSVGGDTLWWSVLRTGWWLEGNLQRLLRPADGDEAWRRPAALGGWSAWRLRPWLELTGSGSWSNPDLGYHVWQLEAGVRLVYDRQVAP